MSFKRRLLAFAASSLFSATLAAPALADAGAAYLDRLPEDEVIYFVLPDRFENADVSNDTGGYPGDRLAHGFDPTHKGFYHGGDLKGLTKRLDYIAGLGATAIWLGPIYKNKPVQGAPGQETAGYHGYWITDFTNVDPHFGTNADLKEFVDAAHARGIKIYLDIITNHTADVIAYRECHDPEFAAYDPPADGRCPYRSKAAYPYTTKGGPEGRKINAGFEGDGVASHENFGKLADPAFAYTPYIPAGEENSKTPAWLNNISLYHNRGDSTFEGESSLYGDFAGLDDLMTEHPVVVEGMIDIFKTWISDYKMDGFRVDTARHVNPEFWRAFIPAIVKHAEEEGIPNFYVFGESFIEDPALLARETHISDFPAVLDFATWSVAKEVIAGDAAPRALDDRFKSDILFKGGEAQALKLPVFIGNHDAGRFGHELIRRNPEISDAELVGRIRLGHALLFLARGAPVIYYGDEQGFTGDGNDQDAREDMFPSRVAIYNDNRLAGQKATTAESNFNRKAPLYKAIAELSSIYKAHDALRRGRQVVRLSDTDKGGLLALSRFDPADGSEYLIVLNTGLDRQRRQIEVETTSQRWRSVAGNCAKAASAPGSYRIEIAPLDYIVCRSERKN